MIKLSIIESIFIVLIEDSVGDF